VSDQLVPNGIVFGTYPEFFTLWLTDTGLRFNCASCFNGGFGSVGLRCNRLDRYAILSGRGRLLPARIQNIIRVITVRSPLLQKRPQLAAVEWVNWGFRVALQLLNQAASVVFPGLQILTCALVFIQTGLGQSINGFISSFCISKQAFQLVGTLKVPGCGRSDPR
jgi:hypothetical protein